MSMFSNPFNSKVVSDITKFLNEHRNDLDIDPCLNEKAKEAVDQVENTTILEERRRVLTSLFNEAISACGCKGTNKEANAFGKAVEMHTEEKKKSLPPAFLKNIQKKKDAAKKEEFEEDEEDELAEANQRLRKPKPHEEVYYKWFDGVSVSIMDMTLIAKEIQAALDSKADLKKVMPELVKKYRKD